MIICINCYRPNESNDKSCLHCSGEAFKETKPNYKYSIKQWEHFIKSLSRGASHDFSPHEFNEDGTINRGGGRTGSTGYNGGYKSGKQMRNERRALERSNHKSKKKK